MITGKAIKTTGITAKPVTSFSVASWSTGNACAYWTAPTSGKFNGTRVMYKDGSYPSSPTDGTLFYEGEGSDLQLTATVTVHGAASGTFTVGATYYFSCFSYCVVGVTKRYNKKQYLSAQWTAQSFAGFAAPITGSGFWTVPTGVRTINALLVGGGGGGGGNASYSPTFAGYATRSGGAGGGGYTTLSTISVIPEEQLYISIGGGGGNGSSGSQGTSGSWGGNGGETWIHRGSTGLAGISGGGAGAGAAGFTTTSASGYMAWTGGGGGTGGGASGSAYTVRENSSFVNASGSKRDITYTSAGGNGAYYWDTYYGGGGGAGFTWDGRQQYPYQTNCGAGGGSPNTGGGGYNQSGGYSGVVRIYCN